ncbi:hypothetical protein J2Z69_002676 [Paenibacillus shirakamiensis]|uniref:Inositolphosphotransferase Aur1/Ipt1 domain-containing protein n=1 Tax=Paenibacillus shirakamiensis TaxID=1265935 RepID=A0ABS4JKM4_9BACL|nr:phosphatase PAP2 family protein [Paenibacillus shirakamiensis]MBP2001631.1 hypothetical protein [Paenibacillus shirakamiensis]
MRKSLLNKSFILALGLLSSLGFMSIFYTLLNEDSGKAQMLYSPVDAWLPFIPGMVIPYILWYPFIFVAMTYICFKDRSVYYRILITMNICLVICYVIYYQFQTTVPRPFISPTSWSRRLVLSLYQRDEPFNCFPSIHALHSYLIMRAAWASKQIGKRAKWVISLCSSTIILSTFLIKQHVIYDAISSALLGEAIFAVVCALWIVRRRRRHQWENSMHS